MFTQKNITSTKMSLFTGNHVEKNRCCDSIRCCTIATMDYGTDPISSFLYITQLGTGTYCRRWMYKNTCSMSFHSSKSMSWSCLSCYVAEEPCTQGSTEKFTFRFVSLVLFWEIFMLWGKNNFISKLWMWYPVSNLPPLRAAPQVGYLHFKRVRVCSRWLSK